ncbi:response regulator transcription factor [Leptospira brenneri]|uniref:response regulator transcription factor n=1 Tax=Leptospira brenneri TaxID=2023182 RepID=UPI000C2B1537|nr:response regulator transcription factor [Leptospira brenneri]PJZ44120.1 DNA-binding response regulator [Leptospira brenneri]
MVSKSSIGVFIIDDHPMLRKGLQSEIEADPDLKFVGSAESIREGLLLISFKQTNVLIMDISLKDENGISEFSNIKNKFPNLKIVFFTMHRDWTYLQKVAILGADAYILKTESVGSIISIVKQVYVGKKVFPEEVMGIVDQLDFGDNLAKKIETLTKREKEIITHLMDGKINREIASDLQLSIRTVEAHRSSIMQKLEIDSSIKLAQIILRLQSSNLL